MTNRKTKPDRIERLIYTEYTNDAHVISMIFDPENEHAWIESNNTQEVVP